MATKVIDASAAAAVLFVEPEAAVVAARIEGSVLLAPTLFGYEIANICVKKLHRHPGQATLTLDRYARLGRLRVEQTDVDIPACLDLARRFVLTAYDASYLWLARNKQADLVTLDQKLARAAAAS